MNPKKILITGTMALTIAMSGSGMWNQDAKAAQLQTRDAKPHTLTAVGDDQLGQLLGATEEDIYYALHAGQSLADFASARLVDPQAVIDLQVSELLGQLEQRLADGSISQRQFEAQLSELPDIIAKSVMGNA